jgi:LysM repeat protein
MKRTTIFPSKLGTWLGRLPAVVGLALGGLALPVLGTTALRAQQTPVPATHVVQRGETLWSLAQQYLGDPLLWPEIYRVNTGTIEDPHWIFPGEELQIGAAQQGAAAAPVTPSEGAAPGITVAPAAADSEPAPAPQGAVVNPATGPTIFASQGRARIGTGTLQLREQRAYRAVREGEYYSAGFVLDAGEQLNAGRLLGNIATSSISRLATTTTTMLYGTVAVVPPPGDTLKPGALLLAYDMPRLVSGYGSVVRPTGLLKVTGAGETADRVLAQVVEVYQTIDGGQGVIRAQTFRSPRGARAVPVPADSGVQGEVIGLLNPHEVVNAQDQLFINRGSADGVHLGDLFQVSRTTSEQSEVGAIVQKQAQVLIVNVRSHTATGIIIQMDRPDIRPGSAVRQLRRMPS